MWDVSGLGRSDVDIVVMLGAGAVADSWEPVLDAIADKVPGRDPEAANVYFATLVQRLRFTYAMSRRPGVAPRHRHTYRTSFDEAMVERSAVTTTISNNLKTWGRNTLRPEAALIRERWLSDYRYSIVTTNWDFSATQLMSEDYTENCEGWNALHGTYEIGLYLPGEVIEESYRQQDNLHEFSTSALEATHQVRDAASLVLYGLSVSPLDTELGLILSAAARQRSLPFLEVVVVDPKHEQVIRNLRVHLGAQNYVGMKPEGLHLG